MLQAGFEFLVALVELSVFLTEQFGLFFEFVDVTLTFADGEANLGELVSEVGSDAFHGPDELYAELQNVLPVEAVGEPGQSDGDA